MIRLGLFSRFFALFGVTTILLGICIAAAVNVFSEDTARQMLEQKHDNLLKFLTRLHTRSNNLEQLHTYAGEMKGDLLVIKNQQRLTTTADFPTVEVLLDHAEPIGELHFAKYKSGYYLLYDTENGWIAVTSGVLDFAIYPWWLVLWPWLAMLVILSLSYLILRKLLAPIFAAVHTVKAISNGNFEQLISKHPGNELAELTRGINQMATELKSMFEAKNELLLAISHELRTPLARMQISLAMLQESEPTRDIKKDLQQMDLLLGQLLEGERLESGHKALHLKTCYLPTLITEVIEEEPLINRVSLGTEIPELAVKVDIGRIKFLLRNLLLNGVKHNTDTTSIDLMLYQQAQQLTLVIQDTGQGIPQQALPKLFDAFYCVDNSTHRDVKGTGLGLYLCKKIALAHSGSIQVTSELGQGSCFTVQLPVISD